jgi:glutamate dehydrogenase/leucine dehydrogenase
MDMPTMGMGCGKKEIGYMYGQYKRVTTKVGMAGRGFLGGGQPGFPESNGYGVVHFAEVSGGGKRGRFLCRKRPCPRAVLLCGRRVDRGVRGSLANPRC